MVDPHAAARNFARLAGIGARGRYGFYEALDYTPSRLPEDAQRRDRARLHGAPSGHDDRRDRRCVARRRRCATRFHAEPMVQATELLLQERTPRDVAVVRPWAAEANVDADGAASRHRQAAGDSTTAHDRGARDPPAVERPLRGDADRRRLRLQPLAGSRRDALARGCHLRRLGLLHLPARRRQRRGLVGRLPAQRRRAGQLRCRRSTRTAPSSPAATAR